MSQVQLEIDIELLRKNKLFIATPMYGGQCYGSFSKSTMDLMHICLQHQVPLIPHFLFNESLITRARNYCCDEFMRSDAQHLMFIDSDIGFNPHDILALASLQAQKEDYDIIGAAYPKKCIAWEKVKAAVDNGVADKDPEVLSNFVGDFVFNPIDQGSFPVNQPVQVLEIGTGFMMISKKALTRFADMYPEFLYRPDHVRTKHFDGSREIMQFFQAEIDQLDWKNFYEQEINKLMKDNESVKVSDLESVFQKALEINSKKSKRYLSEDYWFCQKARAIGLKTWLCPWMQLQHTGTYTFGGSLAALASIKASATVDPSQLKK